MPADGERQVLGPHAAAIVDDAQQRLAAAGRGDVDAGGAGIERIFDELLGGACRALDYLAGGDLVDERFGKLGNGHALFSLIPPREKSAVSLLPGFTGFSRGSRHEN